MKHLKVRVHSYTGVRALTYLCIEDWKGEGGDSRPYHYQNQFLLYIESYMSCHLI